MKNNKTTNVLVFSYILSILLINPIIRKLIDYYEFSFVFILILYIVSGLLVTQILNYINLKFNFVENTIKNSFFQYWLVFSLKVENALRSNTFLFGFFISLILVMLIITWIQGFSIKKFWLLISYYYVMVYIKIRTNLINNEILKVNLEHCLNWQDFINFYKIKNTLKRNFVFKNITTFHDTHLIIQVHKKSSKFIQQKLKFLIGLLTGLISSYSYFNIVSQVDGSHGVRTKTLRNITSAINAVQIIISNKKKVSYDEVIYNSNFLEQLSDDLMLFEKLKQKISSLPLVYFLYKNNRDRIKQIGDIVIYYNGPNCLEIHKLKNFLKNNDFLNILIDNTTDKVV